MITDLILAFIYYFLYGILGPFLLLPDVALPESFTSAISTATHYLGIVNSILPLTTVALSAGIGIFLAIEIGINTFKIVKWVYTKIPGIG